jgi:YbbR domain-containing protein
VFAAPRQVSAQSSSEHDKQELERLEKIWNEAHENGNADVLQSLWADDIEVDVPKIHYATSDINIRVSEMQPL